MIKLILRDVGGIVVLARGVRLLFVRSQESLPLHMSHASSAACEDSVRAA